MCCYVVGSCGLSQYLRCGLSGGDSARTVRMLLVDTCDGRGCYRCMDSVWRALTTLGRTLNSNRANSAAKSKASVYTGVSCFLPSFTRSLRSFSCNAEKFGRQVSPPLKLPTGTFASTKFKLGSIHHFWIISNPLAPCLQD